MFRYTKPLYTHRRIQRQQKGVYFQQAEPHLGNQYTQDLVLTDLLKRKLPEGVLGEVERDFERFGGRVSVGGDILEHGRHSEANPPVLKQRNAWGRRRDVIETSYAWDILKDISAEEGLVSIGYGNDFDEYSRLIQFVKLYLFTPSSAVFTCPLAMTDGGARLIQVNRQDTTNPKHLEILDDAFSRFTSRDPDTFWTSEKTGGSDVSGSETTAIPIDDDMFNLSGYKYFTSSTTSEATFLLGRINDDKKLSTFFLKTHIDGELNNITIHKLKEKLGTRAVPTAELELNDSKGFMVGQRGRGVKAISSILNITRIHNMTLGVGSMRRAIALARDYSKRRSAFGQKLSENPLHVKTFAENEVVFRGCMHLFMDILVLLGKSERGVATADEEALLRLLTPVGKAHIGKKSIYVVSEMIEALGGTGYMEDSDVPRLLRDVQVGAIWEGTTNVLSMDMLRPIKEGALGIFISNVKDRVHACEIEELHQVKTHILGRLDYLRTFPHEEIVMYARNIANSIADTYSALLLLEQAESTKSVTDIVTASLYVGANELDKRTKEAMFDIAMNDGPTDTLEPYV